MRQFYVYILGSRSLRLYVGVTNDLARRVLEHRNREHSGFTAKYCIVRLLYYEATPFILNAIAREKQIKGWSRRKKLELIATQNPGFADRTGEVLDEF